MRQVGQLQELYKDARSEKKMNATYFGLYVRHLKACQCKTLTK